MRKGILVLIGFLVILSCCIAGCLDSGDRQLTYYDYEESGISVPDTWGGDNYVFSIPSGELYMLNAGSGKVYMFMKSGEHKYVGYSFSKSDSGVITWKSLETDMTVTYPSSTFILKSMSSGKYKPIDGKYIDYFMGYEMVQLTDEYYNN